MPEGAVDDNFFFWYIVFLRFVVCCFSYSQAFSWRNFMIFFSKDAVKRLQVHLMELLRYPYLLHLTCLADLFIKGIITLNKCGSPLRLEEKLPGAYLLLVHPDIKVGANQEILVFFYIVRQNKVNEKCLRVTYVPNSPITSYPKNRDSVQNFNGHPMINIYIYFQVRAWAVRCVRDLGLISPDDYDLLTNVIGWMINVVQFNLFENIDALSPENTNAELPFDFLPPHLFISLTRREYWLGLFVLLRQMDVSTVRTSFTKSTEHATFLGTLLSLMGTEIRGNLIYFDLFTFIALLGYYHHLPNRTALYIIYILVSAMTSSSTNKLGSLI